MRNQLAENFKLVYHKSRSQKIVLKETKNILRQEAYNKFLIEALLKEEGALSNIWQNLKQAGSAAKGFLGGQGDVSQRLASAQASVQQQQVKAQQQAQSKQVQAAVKEINNLINQAMKARQKFEQELLKQAESISAYHDSVLALAQSFQKADSMLGGASPEISRIKDQVEQQIEQLLLDLETEKEGIEGFLKSAKGSVDKFTAEFGASKARGREKAAADKEKKKAGEEYGRSMTGQARMGTNRIPTKIAGSSKKELSPSQKDKLSKYVEKHKKKSKAA